MPLKPSASTNENTPYDMNHFIRILTAALLVTFTSSAQAGPDSVISRTWQEIPDPEALSHCDIFLSADMVPTTDRYAPYAVKILCRITRPDGATPIELSIDDVKVNEILGRKFLTGTMDFDAKNGAMAVLLISVAPGNELGLKGGEYIFYGFAIGSAMGWKTLPPKFKVSTVRELNECFGWKGYTMKSIGVVARLD